MNDRSEDKQKKSDIRNHSSFRAAKTESSPMKIGDFNLSNKSPGVRMTNNKKAMLETPKKSQIGFGKKVADQSRKKMKEVAPEEPMKLPDCLAEFFSKNEFKSAVLES